MIRVTVTGADKLTAFAKRIAPGSKPRALEALAKYFLGNDARGLRHYPPPRPSKYVRTYKLKNGWYAGTPEGNSVFVANRNVPYAVYVQGNPPASHMSARGWRGALDVIESNMKGAIRSATAAVVAWMKANV